MSGTFQPQRYFSISRTTSISFSAKRDKCRLIPELRHLRELSFNDCAYPVKTCSNSSVCWRESRETRFAKNPSEHEIALILKTLAAIRL